MNKKDGRPFYEACYDGMMSTVIEITADDVKYEYHTVDNYEFFWSRAKAVRALRARLRREIRDLKYCLKHLH